MLTEIEQRAWASRGGAEKHKPEMACKAVLHQMGIGGLSNVKHIVVVVIEDVGGCDRVNILQAGELSEIAVEGALMRAVRMQSSE